MHFDPMIWTRFSTGKILAVRETVFEKMSREQDKHLLSPWANALAMQQLQRDLLHMPVKGEA